MKKNGDDCVQITDLDFILHDVLKRVLVLKNVADDNSGQNRLAGERLLGRNRKKHLQSSLVKNCDEDSYISNTYAQKADVNRQATSMLPMV